MANPENHFKTFFRLGALRESEELKPFINHHILKYKKRFTDKLETWGQVVDLNRKAFKNQGTIETDGVEDLNQTIGRCAFIDPGQRDLMHCIKEPFIFTKNNRSKLSRHFRVLRKQTKPSNIEAAENILSRTHPSSVNLDKFVQYIEARASVDGLLNQYYGNETIDEKCNLYYGHLFVTKFRCYFPQNSTLPDTTTKSFTEEDFKLAEEMLTGKHNEQKIRINTLLENLQILPFRKMKFSSKIYYDQNDEELVRSLKKKFGSDAVLIFGDWSAPNTKFQEPIRNKGFIRILKKNGFTVYLINEYKTSSHCPHCESALEKFKHIINSRPYKREAMSVVQ
ncbi:MAG: hypothetical protein EXX96DRAFT_602747 [Benjaminiella poitrasii]|nr:MAG: hypothetical protein EXX96DRAFT_602747 [Benjaminiella poitrasii]